jgi:hypothetical protein
MQKTRFDLIDHRPSFYINFTLGALDPKKNFQGRNALRTVDLSVVVDPNDLPGSF